MNYPISCQPSLSPYPTPPSPPLSPIQCHIFPQGLLALAGLYLILTEANATRRDVGEMVRDIYSARYMLFMVSKVHRNVVQCNVVLCNEVQ